jgi:hypothetical protein
MGDPFPEITSNSRYHEHFGALYTQQLGGTLAAIRSAGYWPITLAASMSPLVFALGVIGMVAAHRERFTRVVAFVTLPLVALLTVQSLRGDAILVARFTILHGALLALFVARGFRVFATRRLARALAVTATVTALAWPVALVWRSQGRGDWLAERLRQLSPLPSLAPSVAAAADWLAAHPAADVLFDHERYNWEGGVVYYSGLPWKAIHVVKPKDTCTSLPRVDCAVLFDGGQLACLGDGDSVTVAGQPLGKVGAWPAPGGVGVRIYCQGN